MSSDRLIWTNGLHIFQSQPHNTIVCIMDHLCQAFFRTQALLSSCTFVFLWCSANTVPSSHNVNTQTLIFCMYGAQTTTTQRPLYCTHYTVGAKLVHFKFGVQDTNVGMKSQRDVNKLSLPFRSAFLTCCTSSHFSLNLLKLPS